MNRICLSLSLLVISSTVASAFDKHKIQDFCNSTYTPNKTAVKKCIQTQTEAAKKLAELRAISTSEGQIWVLDQCAKDFQIDYASNMDCVVRTFEAALPSSKSDSVPSFDSATYCHEVAAAVGGSYQIEKACRDQEQNSRAELQAQSIPPDITKICEPIAKTVGGSYEIFKACVQQEMAAKAALQ